MNNISTNLNLSALKHARKKMKLQNGNEVECLVIPIELNHLFQGKEGAVYLNTIGFPMKERKEHETHIIKQSFKKEFLDTLTEEERKSLPIFGNHSVYDGPTAQVNNVSMESGGEKDDDLPF
jgi:hypothetical protein